MQPYLEHSSTSCGPMTGHKMTFFCHCSFVWNSLAISTSNHIADWLDSLLCVSKCHCLTLNRKRTNALLYVRCYLNKENEVLRGMLDAKLTVQSLLCQCTWNIMLSSSKHTIFKSLTSKKQRQFLKYKQNNADLFCCSVHLKKNIRFTESTMCA